MKNTLEYYPWRLTKCYRFKPLFSGTITERINDTGHLIPIMVKQCLPHHVKQLFRISDSNMARLSWQPPCTLAPRFAPLAQMDFSPQLMYDKRTRPFQP